MSKDKLRSSGERRRRGVANGAGELPLRSDFLLEQCLLVCYNKR